MTRTHPEITLRHGPGVGLDRPVVEGDLTPSSSATSTPRWLGRERTVLRLLAESG